MLGKRKANGPDLGPPPKQKTIYPAYFIPELAHIVAMCDEKLPFVNFAKELSQMGIPHSGLQVEANATTLGLKLLALPKPSATTAADMAKMKCVSPPAVTKDVWTSLMKRLLGTTIRLHSNRHNQTRSWTAELVFFSTPLASAMNKEQGMRRPVYLHFDMLAAGQTEKTIQLFLEDWARIVYLYALIHDFAEVYKSGEWGWGGVCWKRMVERFLIWKRVLLQTATACRTSCPSSRIRTRACCWPTGPTRSRR